MYPKKGRNEIKPYAVAPLCFWKPARKDLGLHPARASDIFTAWRRRTLILWNWLCSALNLSAYAPCLGNGQICLSIILCGFTCHTALYCCCCRTPLPLGGWEMDRPFPPYVLDVTIRDSSLGSAPGPEDMLNEFLHRLGPIAHGTLGTMIHNSFANGSLPGSWEIGSIFLFPNPWEGSMPPSELQTHHAALCVTTINRRNDSPPSVSVIAAPPASTLDLRLRVLRRTWWHLLSTNYSWIE
ncbi:hypothetical protein TCDM_13448 [Trypanosoma cruzi Dm28c]|uniref:Uncharacterized protein n=1 Tax=Trypanosoma cruzi Dm28c TaxID=1416333 RepID=V5CIC4_TRYCR|nr:hypothetical protein TCDM_13448 [Trypanosoma cruzi Dm28c]